MQCNAYNEYLTQTFTLVCFKGSLPTPVSTGYRSYISKTDILNTLNIPETRLVQKHGLWQQHSEQRQCAFVKRCRRLLHGTHQVSFYAYSALCLDAGKRNLVSHSIVPYTSMSLLSRESPRVAGSSCRFEVLPNNAHTNWFIRHH